MELLTSAYLGTRSPLTGAPDAPSPTEHLSVEDAHMRLD